MNLINNALIIPPNETRHCRYCPREEIAHPLKLKAVVDAINIPPTSIPLQWQIFNNNINVYYTSWLPWYKMYRHYDDYIHTSLFHIVTERPAMFTLFSKLVNNPLYSRENCKPRSSEAIDYTRELHDWLLRWWNSPFLITIPIMHNRNGAFITDNMYPPNRMWLNDYPPGQYLDLQLTHQSYTIANGLTLFLAYHRLGIITANIAYPILNSFIKITDPHVFQDVTDVWYNLYYSTTIPHIADFPAYYVAMGPHFAHENVVRLFDTLVDFQFSELMIPTTIVYTSPYVTMFPYFNTALWKHYKSHDSWLNTANIEIDTGDVIFSDISGFIHGILSTKRSWKYWEANYEELLVSIAESYISVEKLLEDLLQTCSYYYKYGSPYHNRSLKRKVRKIWNNVLEILDIDHVFIPDLFKKFILKYQLFERLMYVGRANLLLFNELPYALLKDIFRIYNNQLDIYTKTNYIIISQHIEVLRIIYPDIVHQLALIENAPTIAPAQQPPQPPQPAQPNAAAGNLNILANNIIDVLLTTPRYYIRRSILQLMKECFYRSTIKTFHENYIEKRILFKLCAIYKAFGMYTNNNTYTVGPLSNNYNVGCILIEYLKIHPNLLIQ